MNILTVEKALQLLDEANEMNPGPWKDHSLYTGIAAKNIAAQCPNLDKDKAQALGTLHDIGRRFGNTVFKHTIDGYKYLMDLGYTDAARICLTHSFPAKNIKEFFGKIDCSKEEYEFSEQFINEAQYDDYDRLIQLCDALCLSWGFCLMEKRMIDVALRHGVHDYIVPKWKATFEIKKHFEQLMDSSIYEVLPGVIENTFGLDK